MKHRFQIQINGTIDDQLEDEPEPVAHDVLETILRDSFAHDLAPGVEITSEDFTVLPPDKDDKVQEAPTSTT